MEGRRMGGKWMMGILESVERVEIEGRDELMTRNNRKRRIGDG